MSSIPADAPSRTSRSGEPRLSALASWAVLAASFGLSAATWVALAELAGFTGTAQAFGITWSLAWLMPVAVDGYLVVALVLWMAPVPAKVATFAKRNTYGAAIVGVTAQSAYHALTTAQAHPEHLWRAGVALVVGALPPGVAALAVHMRALIVRESAAPVAVPAPAPVRVPQPPRFEPAPTAPTSTAQSDPVPALPPVPVQDEYAQVTAPISPAPPVPDAVPEPAAEPVRPARRTDAELLRTLRSPRRVPRDPDGTVPIRRAAKTLGIGTERARRLLEHEGLLRTGDDGNATDDAPEPEPVLSGS